MASSAAASTLAETCITACAEAWRGDGEILASAFGVIPQLAVELARRTYAPGLLVTDGVAHLVSDTTTGDGSSARPVVEGWMPYRRVFDTLWAGRRHAMMGAAQIDRFGNSNISCIGPWQQPRAQLVGMRGAPGNTINHPCSYWVPSHSRRVFVEHVDVVSGVGYEPELWSGGIRSDYHEIRLIVSDIAVMDMKGPDRTLRVRSLHPGVTLDQLLERTGFEPALASDLSTTPAPSKNQLRLIREVLDPDNRRDEMVRPRPRGAPGTA